MRWYFSGLYALSVLAPLVQVLSLEQAMGRAEKNHPELRALEAEIAEEEGNKLSARALVNPELTVGPGLKSTSDGNTSKSQFHGQIEISQRFEFPGKRSLRILLAEKNIRLKQIALEGFRNQHLIEVRRVFYQAQVAQQIAKLRSEQVHSAETFLQSAKKRVAAGYASDFEAMKAQADFIAAQKGLGESLAEIQLAKLKLAGLMGSPSDTTFEIEGEFNRYGFPTQESGSLSKALASNPALKAGALELELAEKNIDATKLNLKPDLTVSPALEFTSDEQIYGLNFSLPLPVWDRGKGVIQVANAQHRRAQAKLEKLKQEISIAVQSAQAKVKLSDEQLALYPPQFLDELKSIMTRAEKVYGQSSTTLLIYLEARRSYFDGLADYYQTLSQWTENQLDLESAVGALTETKFQKAGEQ